MDAIVNAPAIVKVVVSLGLILAVNSVTRRLALANVASRLPAR